MNLDLKNSIWNILDIFILKKIKESRSIYSSGYEEFIETIWFSFLKKPLDKIPSTTYDLVFEIRYHFFKWEYLDTYDFVDFIAQQECPFDKEEFIDSMNFVFERELSGYRFVSNKLSPITNDLEINQIEQAIEQSQLNGFRGVAIHLESALSKVNDRKAPDYRNSIKESISAIESICQVLTNEKGAELGKTLKLLESKMPLHGALKQGFIKLYGYTSDSDGIRHAMMNSDNLDQEDAIYMLVTCSSFINYLIRKSQKAGLLN